MSVRERRLLVTGSRHWKAVMTVRDALQAQSPAIVTHGAAPGLDRMADHIVSRWATEGDAKGRIWPKPDPHRANWKEEGLFAGPQRNQDMVNLGPYVALAFPDADSIGTFDCAGRALRAGIPTYFFTGPGLDTDRCWDLLVSYGLSHGLFLSAAVERIRELCHFP